MNNDNQQDSSRTNLTELATAQKNDTLSEILEKGAPRIKTWQEGEAAKATIETAIEREFIAADYKFKRLLILVFGIGMLAVLSLRTYLFIVNKDTIAANLLTITLTGVISFLGGFGLGKSSTGTGH